MEIIRYVFDEDLDKFKRHEITTMELLEGSIHGEKNEKLGKWKEIKIIIPNEEEKNEKM